MSTTRGVLGAAAAAAATALTLSPVPAHADDALVVKSEWGTAKYVQATKKVCARVDKAFGDRYYVRAGIAHLDAPDGWFVFSDTRFGDFSNAWECEARPPRIIEGKKYWLVVKSCLSTRVPECTTKRRIVLG